MLEHIPHWLGALMRSMRAGADKLVIVQPRLGIGEATLRLSSPAFGDRARLPARFTADGAGVSPPLVWTDPPPGTAGFCLIVEDPDAPAPNPLVHAVVWGIPARERFLAEGAIARDGTDRTDGRDVGRNSFFAEGWLPPDPPTGHGVHDYAFQLFALDAVPQVGGNPGRGDVVEAMAGHVLAAGLLIGTYSRGEERPAGSGSPVRGALPA